MKKFVKILISIFVIIIFAAGLGLMYISKGLKEGSRVKIQNVTPEKLNSGTYSGKYEAGRWTNEVNVTVKDHKITKIDVIKDVTFSKPEVTEELFNKVIQKQSTDVNSVSGATVTSKAYLKSIENALNK